MHYLFFGGSVYVFSTRNDKNDSIKQLLLGLKHIANFVIWLGIKGQIVLFKCKGGLGSLRKSFKGFRQ